jgi:zona occludens toxin (predicted ATPase)
VHEMSQSHSHKNLDGHQEHRSRMPYNNRIKVYKENRNQISNFIFFLRFYKKNTSGKCQDTNRSSVYQYNQ